MGLAERRAARSFKETHYPDVKKELDRIVGFEVPVDVDWDSIAAEGHADVYEEAFPKIYFRPLTEALKAVCIDDLGIEAVKKKVKRITIGHTESSSDVSFTMGTLKIDYPFSNVDYWQERKTEIQSILEKSL